MTYFILMNPCRGFKAESLAADSHVDATMELLRAANQQRRAFVCIKLKDGTYVQVGGTIAPHDKGKPWTFTLMSPQMIQGFHPTVQLLGDTV